MMLNKKGVWHFFTTYDLIYDIVHLYKISLPLRPVRNVKGEVLHNFCPIALYDRWCWIKKGVWFFSGYMSMFIFVSNILLTLFIMIQMFFCCTLCCVLTCYICVYIFLWLHTHVPTFFWRYSSWFKCFCCTLCCVWHVIYVYIITMNPCVTSSILFGWVH